jgi:hypothetical protein
MSSEQRSDNSVPMFSDHGLNAGDSDRLQLFFGWAFATQWFELLQAADLAGLLAFNRKLRIWLVKTYGQEWDLIEEFDVAIGRLEAAVERRAS